MTITVDAGDGRIIEFPDVETANAFFQSQGGEAAPEKAGLLSDVLGSLGSGVVRGATAMADLPSTVFNLGATGLEKGYEFVTGNEMPEGIRRGLAESGKLPGGVDMRRGYATEAATAILPKVMGYEPLTTAGEYAQTVGEFLPGAAGGGAKALGSMVGAGLASEAAGQATEGTALEPYARVAAGVAVPTAGAALAKRIISPFGGVPSAERMKMAKVLDDAGVPITAGQRTGSEALRRIEGRSAIAGRVSDAQGEAFTKAALKTIGETADRATPEVLERATKRIGAVFDDAVSGVEIKPTPQALTQSSKILQSYRQMKPKAEAAPMFTDINKALVQSFRTGNPIDAANAKSWRSTLSKLTKSPDTATREAAIDMLDLVDDAFSDALRAAGKGELVKKLGEARGQYRNLLAVEAAASRAGEGVAEGILSPSQLRNAVVAQGRRAFVQGKRGEIGDLTRAAEGVMKPLPTTEAGGLRDVRGVTEMIGAGAGGAAGGPVGAMMGVMVPTVGRELAATSPMQRYFANQLVNSRGTNMRQGVRALPGLLAQ
jgi:hypothetical protein